MRVNKLFSLSRLIIIISRRTGFRLLVVAGAAFFLSVSCNDDNRIKTDPVEFSWSFTSEAEGWTGDFADYPVGKEHEYQLYFGYDSLPLPLDPNQGALKVSGMNLNNNLFMFVKKRITDLEPNTVYYATFTVEFATNEPGNELNAASVPGGNIFIGAGATSVEPEKTVGESNLYGLNIGKCNEDQDGEDMIVLGNITNDEEEPVFALKTVSNQKPFHCVTNEAGELWIIIAVDSGVESATEIYYNTITVSLF